MAAKAAEGVNAAVSVPLMYVTAPATAEPLGDKSVNVEVFRVVAFIASLKVAVIGAVVDTPVAGGVVTGEVELTVGAVAAAVVNCHETELPSGPPKESVTLPAMVAVYVALLARVADGVKVATKVLAL